jgi:hypothetical protein
MTVLFPEVGVVNAVTDRQRFGGGDGGVSDETLDHLVRLVVAVYRNPGSPTVAAATGQWILPHADESDRFLHRCVYLLVHDAVATVETRRELLRSFLLNLPPPPPAVAQVSVPAAVPVEVIVVSDSENEDDDEGEAGEKDGAEEEDDDDHDLALDRDAEMTDNRSDAPVPVPPCPRVCHANPAIRRTVPGAAARRPARRPQRPPVMTAIWYETLVAAEHFGGLFVGGPDGCVWTLWVIPILYGNFRGPKLARSNQFQNDRNDELLQLLVQVLGPKLAVLGPEDATIVDIIRNEATSRRAINRIGRFLAEPRMGPERRPLTVPEIQDVLVRDLTGAGAVAVAVAERPKLSALSRTNAGYVHTLPSSPSLLLSSLSGGTRPDLPELPACE